MDLSSFPADPLQSWWPYVISAVVGLIACIKNFMGGIPCPTSNRIDGKVVIITGASGGVGFEISKELAKRGGNIIMCCRSLKKGVKAMNKIKKCQPDALLTLKKLDLTSEASVKSFVSCLENITVDVLINNAGVIHHPYKITEDGHEIHLATNYLGHFLLTHLLLDNLKKSDHGRVINVCAGSYQCTNLPLTCRAEREKYSPKEWFGQSKLALILMTKHLTKLLNGTRITINAMNPGMIRNTEHLRHSVIMRNWSVKVSMAPWMWIFMKSPNQGAQTAIYLATDPLLINISGKFYNNCAEEETVGLSNNAEAAKILYHKTCELLNAKAINSNKNSH